MPWVEISTIARANRILELAPRSNAAVLPDAIHFFREANRLESWRRRRPATCSFCDAPREKPASMDEIRRQARADRLMPGEGGLDLRGLLAALPRDLPVCLEIPYARPLPPLERARLALEKSRPFL
jgi:sugar phosphate isomerase/epimerase